MSIGTKKTPAISNLKKARLSEVTGVHISQRCATALLDSYKKNCLIPERDPRLYDLFTHMRMVDFAQVRGWGPVLYAEAVRMWHLALFATPMK